MTAHDVDTVLAVVLADDLREQLRTADTLPAPVSVVPSMPSFYIEVPWKFDGRALTISGRVRGDEITCFAAEDQYGVPVRIPDAFLPDALADLVQAYAEARWTP